MSETTEPNSAQNHGKEIKFSIKEMIISFMPLGQVMEKTDDKDHPKHQAYLKGFLFSSHG